MAYKLTKILNQLEAAGLPEPYIMEEYYISWRTVRIHDPYNTGKWNLHSDNIKTIKEISLPEAIEKLKELLDG